MSKYDDVLVNLVRLSEQQERCVTECKVQEILKEYIDIRLFPRGSILGAMERIVNNCGNDATEVVFAHFLHEIIKPLQQRVSFLEHQLKEREQ